MILQYAMDQADTKLNRVTGTLVVAAAVVLALVAFVVVRLRSQ